MNSAHINCRCINSHYRLVLSSGPLLCFIHSVIVRSNIMVQYRHPPDVTTCCMACFPLTQLMWPTRSCLWTFPLCRLPGLWFSTAVSHPSTSPASIRVFPAFGSSFAAWSQHGWCQTRDGRTPSAPASRLTGRHTALAANRRPLPIFVLELILSSLF